MNFVQTGATQPSAKKSIDAGRTQSETPGAIRRRLLAAGLGKQPPQDEQSFRTRWRSSFLRMDPMHEVFAQMFVLCSYKKRPKSGQSQAESDASSAYIINILFYNIFYICAPQSPNAKKPRPADAGRGKRENIDALAPINSPSAKYRHT